MDHGFVQNGGNVGIQELVTILHEYIARLENTVRARDAQLQMNDAQNAVLNGIIQAKDAVIRDLNNVIDIKTHNIAELNDAIQRKEEEKGNAQATAAYYRICLEEKGKELEEEKRRQGRNLFWYRQVSLPAPVVPSPTPPALSSISSSRPSSSARRPIVQSRRPVKKEYKKVIPFAQQVYTNSLEAASPVGSFVAALGRWGEWDEKDRKIDGIDIKHFLFHGDNDQVVPQMVRKAPRTGEELYRMKYPGIPDGQRDQMYEHMSDMEKMQLGQDATFLKKWQKIMVKQGMVKVVRED